MTKRTKLPGKYRKDPSAFARVFMRISLFTEDEVTALELPVLLAYEKIKVGACSEQEFFDLYTALKAATVRARDIDPSVAGDMKLAMHHLEVAKEMALSTGRYLFKGPAIELVGVGVHWHNQMIRVSSPLQMKRALETAKREDDEKAQYEQQSRQPVDGTPAAAVRTDTESV